jgi:VanZ like family
MIFSKKNIQQYIPGIAWFFLVWLLITMPPSNIPSLDNWFNKIYPDKWVHAGMFGGLAFLFILPIAKTPFTKKQKTNYAIKILLCVIIWGLTTEFIQKYFVVGRMFDIWDWAADSFGALCGWWICRKWVIK